MTDKARELLERALRDWDSYEEPYFERLTITFEEIRAYLAQSEPTQDEEPVAWMHPYGGILKSPTTGLERETYNIPLYLHPVPRKPFVRLSEEELRSCFTETNEAEPLAEGWPGLERFARAIEDALEEKNK